MIAADRLAHIFVEVADTLTDDFDLIAFLQMLASRSSDLLNISAAGLLLADHNGRLQLMAASDERAQMLELFQLQAHEGPCHECFTQGQAIVAADLTNAGDRWPRWAPLAVGTGFRAVHAFPMRLRNQVIGALNLFSTEAGTIDPADARIVQALADVATIALIQERAIRHGEILTEHLHGALDSRIAIERARGALALIHGCSVDEAYELLQGYVRESGRSISEVAREVTTSPGSIPELTTPVADVD